MINPLGGEASIVINGVELTQAQAMFVREAVQRARFFFGNDYGARVKTRAYEARRAEVFRMLTQQRPR